jgi:hypothetical protein
MKFFLYETCDDMVIGGEEMKRILNVLLIIVLVITMAGCIKVGPSPIYAEQSGVTVNSQNSGSPFVRYQAPEHWANTIVKDDLTVIVDADVVVPDYGQFNTTVVARDEISQETADRIRTTLLGDAVLYMEYPPEYPYTKSEIQEWIDNARNEITDPQSEYNTVEKYKPDAEEYLAAIERRISTLEDMYKYAPDTFVPGLADTQFHEVKRIDVSLGYTTVEIQGMATLDDGRKMDLRIDKKGGVFFRQGPVTEDSCYFELEDLSWGDRMRWVDADTPLLEAGITIEQASEIARNTVRDMGLDYLDISSVEE